MVTKDIPQDVHDIIIIGGGPAGLTAGLYAARGRMKTLMTESLSIMGQATMTDVIENYPGIEQSSGIELIMNFKKQAESFGLVSRAGTVKSVSRVESGGCPVWRIEDENGTAEALALIVASGAKAKKLGVLGEDAFLGKGVSYCATCDGAFFREKDIIVIGGGDTAVEEALFLTRFGRKVTVIHRKDRLRASGIVRDRAMASKNMEFVWDSVVEEIAGTETVKNVIVKNVKTGKISEVPCDGVFIFVGWQPNTGFLGDEVKKGADGSIIVDAEMRTSAEGVFAGGDCCQRPLHQVITACGDGAVAAFSAQHYVERLRGVEYK